MTAPLAPVIAALRGGRPIRIIGGPVVASTETTTPALLELLDPDSSAKLLISGERAAALGLANEGLAAEPASPVLIERAEWLDGMTARLLVDPAHDLARAPLGPLTPVHLPDPEGARAALHLSQLAGLLPALWMLDARVNPTSEIDVASALAAHSDVTIVGRARLPVGKVGDAQIIAFRESATGEEHVALLFGAFGGEPPLVRLHSECLTGDVFGSLKCDCGPQLHEAMQLLAAAGGGVLLYLRQEGRGIGLANKIRAYQLQDRGLDTVDANRRLGFPDDLRDYGVAAAMLRELGLHSIRLLTNNPAKLAGLARQGIEVVERVAHHLPVNPHNADYIATKQGRSGHLV